MQVAVTAVFLGLAGVLLLPPAPARAGGAPRDSAVPVAQPATDISAQSRRYRRPPTRIRVYPLYNPDDVYPRYYPGRNAVRDCTAHLVQEFRPSGTVITPRMNCFWRPG
jgi:hypothetical protein